MNTFSCAVVHPLLIRTLLEVKVLYDRRVPAALGSSRLSATGVNRLWKPAGTSD